MKKGAIYYYLRINNTLILDFKDLPEFYDMEDFLKLNIFTSYFKNRDELIHGLVHLGFLEKSEDAVRITIAKRIGNKKEGYSYVNVDSDICYRDDLNFLTAGAIKRFIYNNRFDDDFIQHLTNTFLNTLENKKRGSQKSIGLITSNLNLASGTKEAKNLQEDIEKKQKSLNLFQREINNLLRIQSISNDLNVKNVPTSLAIESEYMQRLYDFVDEEIFYGYGENKTPNNRGLIKLGKYLSNYYSYHKKLMSPEPISKYNKTLQEFYSLMNLNYTNMSSKTIKWSDDDNDEYSTDEEFLTNDDFLDLLRSDSSKDEIESVYAAIENLEENKKRHGII